MEDCIKMKSHGIITPKVKHECTLPFFDKPIGTLYRCRCGQVWYRIQRNRDNDPFWVKAALESWTEAGGDAKLEPPEFQSAWGKWWAILWPIVVIALGFVIRALLERVR